MVSRLYFPLYLIFSTHIVSVLRHAVQVWITRCLSYSPAAYSYYTSCSSCVYYVLLYVILSRCTLYLLYGIVSRWVLYVIFANLSRCVLPDNNIRRVFQVCIRCSTLCCPGLYYRNEALAAMTKWHKYTCARFVPWVKGETMKEYGLTKEWHVTITKEDGWESTRNKKTTTGRLGGEVDSMTVMRVMLF